MKITYTSDLHLDHYQGQPDRGLPSFPKSDLLIVAGDLSDGDKTEESVDFIMGTVECPVLMVPGNHDYWTRTIEETHEMFRSLAGKYSGRFIPLIRDAVEIGGQRFLGTTLWFQADPLMFIAARRQWPDYRYLQSDTAPEDIQREAELDKSWLEQNVRDTDIVITHHLPTKQSVAPAYTHPWSPTNQFFLHDVEEVIVKTQPKLWFHGHTHTPCDYMVGKTRVLCSPRGYPHENRTFQEEIKTIDL